MTSRRAQSVERRIHEEISSLEALLAPHRPNSKISVIADFMRRVEQSNEIDGAPRGSGSEAVAGGETSNPVLNTVLARERNVCGCDAGQVALPDGRKITCKKCQGTGERWADPVSDAVTEILSRLSWIRTATKAIDRRRRQLVGDEYKARARQDSLQECMACHKTVLGVGWDRLKGGCCNACTLAKGIWKIDNPPSGDPVVDRQKFITWRREQIAAKALAEMEEIERLRRSKALPPKRATA